jgi:hypothetical protein
VAAVAVAIVAATAAGKPRSLTFNSQLRDPSGSRFHF